MIRARIQIGNGPILDTYDGYGLIYAKSDNTLSPETKGFETTSYAEEDGEHVDTRTMFAAFDFSASFVAQAKKIYPNPNLLADTVEMSDASIWTNLWNWTDTGMRHEGCKVWKGGQEWFGLRQSLLDIKVGEVYTYSVWVRVEFNAPEHGTVAFYHNYPGATTSTPESTAITDVVTDGAWHRLSSTFTIIDDNGFVCPRIEASLSSTDVYVAGYKLERGETATGYIPLRSEPGYGGFATKNAQVKTANSVVQEFNEQLFDWEDGIRRYKRITLYDDYKNRKIVGIPYPLGTPEKFGQFDRDSAVLLPLKIRVNDPMLCEFDLGQAQKIWSNG